MPDIITLEAVYDNSDIMTDYFARDTPLETWFVSDLNGKVVNEAKLRSALRHLPEWLQKYGWTYRKGERYSMSDHPYGQLRVDRAPLNLQYLTWNGNRSIGFILQPSWTSTFQMNDSKDNPVPKTFDEFKKFVDQKSEETRKKREEYRAEAARKRAATVSKTREELEKIFEGLTDSEKAGVAFALFPSRLQGLTHEDIVGLMKIREEKGPRMVFDETVKKFRGE